VRRKQACSAMTRLLDRCCAPYVLRCFGRSRTQWTGDPGALCYTIRLAILRIGTPQPLGCEDSRTSSPLLGGVAQSARVGSQVFWAGSTGLCMGLWPTSRSPRTRTIATTTWWALLPQAIRRRERVHCCPCACHLGEISSLLRGPTIAISCRTHSCVVCCTFPLTLSSRLRWRVPAQAWHAVPPGAITAYFFSHRCPEPDRW
jgi:hypothetical protein